MSKRRLFTILFVGVIFLGTAIAIFLVKGYRFSGKTGMVSGTGIISITSLPDQASVYLDGHLTTATNANINSLLPKTYAVRITKDGFISWDKQVEVKEGLVTQVKATLFPAIPTIYPLTFNGVDKVTISPDNQRMFFIVPESTLTTPNQLDNSAASRKSGVWVWNMNSNPIPFAGGPEPHRVAALIPGVDYSKASIRWSPDSTQVLINLPDRSLLMFADRYNDTGQDITATLQPTITTWNDDQKNKDIAKTSLIRDVGLRNTATSSAVLKWSTDETKFLYSVNGKDNYKVADLIQNKTFDMPAASSFNWLSDSRHLIMVESQPVAKDNTLDKVATSSATVAIRAGKVSIIEFDGFNKSEMYVGNFDPNSVFSWPDASRLVIVSSVPTTTGNIPNLFGINLK
jgi:hypothetical protein